MGSALRFEDICFATIIWVPACAGICATLRGQAIILPGGIFSFEFLVFSFELEAPGLRIDDLSPRSG